MSAPETNVDKQVRRHRGPLYGMVFVAVLVAVLFGAFMMWTVDEDNTGSNEAPVVETVVEN